MLVVIYSADGRFLLLERVTHPGYWQSVTGSQEVGETLVATALRELKEETGLMVDKVLNLSDFAQSPLPLNVLIDHQQQTEYEIFLEWRHRYAPGITQNTEHLFSIKLPQVQEIQLAPAEHSAYQWSDGNTAISQCFSPSNQSAIAHVLSREIVIKQG